MLNYSLILFITAMLGGLAVLWVPVLKERVYKLLLVFAGSYLFAITVVHLMPELMSHATNSSRVGMLVLAGFFLQLFLEYLSGGIEHGHLHGAGSNHHHHHGAFTPLTLLLALCLHAFLEGTLLIHPSGQGHPHQTDTLLAGIVLHKAPAAFALMSVLLHQLGRRWLALLFLGIFALASPAGLVFSELIQTDGEGLQLMSQWIYPLVAG
ncbi:ZIP family metal transporter [Cesiribacter andamanensis]|uniref:ZIP Zinc transporter n=1 Tax=Cesiribacter andamanensis AMV16 TaxID=1279009 RepID=M7NFM4_9BACT|nr:ZIP zinc transporter [Cesiribacter andamanensis]EMR00630.1 ZIP Zinc transporter [Cesiribacter andamanensis AMV16]